MRLCAAIVLLLANTAFAQVRTLYVETKECPLNLMCRKEFGYGTCFAVAYSPSRGEYIYLTAGHNLKGSTGNATVCSVDVGGHPARVVAGWVKMATVDFAIVASRLEATIQPIADRDPVNGESLRLTGYDYANSRQSPQVSRVVANLVSVDPGKFCSISRSTTTGMSGGPVLGDDGNCIGMITYDSSILGNWVSPPHRSFKDSVRHYFPDAEFAPAKVEKYERKESPPVKSTVRAMTPQEIDLTEKLRKAREELAAAKLTSQPESRPPATTVESATAESQARPKDTGSKLAALAGGVKKMAEVAGPVITAAAPVAAETGWLALLGPYALPVGAGLWAAREIAPRVTAWNRRRKEKKAGQPVDGMVGYVHKEDGSVALANQPLREQPQPETPDDRLRFKEVQRLKRKVSDLELKLSVPPSFIEVPVDRWNLAFAFAKRHMAEDGTRSTEDFYDKQESLIRQFLAAYSPEGATR